MDESLLNQQYALEADLLEKVLKWLAPQRRDGIKVIRICDRYAKGYSDLFICVQGWFVVAELKAKNGEATPHQTIFIEEMQSVGAIGGECKSIADVAKLIQEAKHAVNKRQPWVGLGPTSSI